MILKSNDLDSITLVGRVNAVCQAVNLVVEIIGKMTATELPDAAQASARVHTSRFGRRVRGGWQAPAEAVSREAIRRLHSVFKQR
jgi:hypothetical protein